MEVVVLGIAAQLIKHVYRFFEDRCNLRKEKKKSPIDYKHPDEVVSCLIENAYAGENGEVPEISCESLGYKLIGPAKRDERWRVFERCDRGPNEGVALERVEDKGSGGAHYIEVKWAKYIVVVRGTIQTRVEDLVDDAKIVFELVCGHHKFSESLVTELYRLQSSTLNVDDGVWVGGHSLGAAIALDATLRLAESKKIVICPHLFNFPDANIDVLFKKFIMSVANGCGSAAGLIPIFGNSLKFLCRWGGRNTTRVLLKLARVSVTFLSEPEVTKEAYRRREKLRQAKFCARMYTNEQDPVSNELIQRSLKPYTPVSIFSLVASLLPIGRGPDSCHLIPPAVLFTNHRAVGSYEAHKLEQWYLFETVDLTVKRICS